MVKTFQAYLPHCHRTYSCIHCRAHLANHDELISKGCHRTYSCIHCRAHLANHDELISKVSVLYYSRVVTERTRASTAGLTSLTTTSSYPR
ncbi:hypothetical protein J6590_014598 [Homalodisca vitripennis]|nr:hypothetical protein J6590_014598 [Homalodisca vitripennis]